MSGKNEVVVKTGEGQEPMATEVLEKAIVDISAAMKKIAGGRLNRETLIHLVGWKSGVGTTEARKVLEVLEELEELLLKPKKK